MQDKSYTAADVAIPIKVLHDKEFVKTAMENKRILLRHLQLCPTNKCNLNCKFCSCADRDKNLELDYKSIVNILEEAKECGCKSITITGGGEPLLHPKINKIIDKCYELDIKVGLVTNGLALDKLSRFVDWCRISFDSNRNFDELSPIVERVVQRFPKIDWAFSFVVYNRLGDVRKVVEFANLFNFTHVRLVSDILNPNDNLLSGAKKILEGLDEKVIYQPRGKSSKGAENCLISLLKPTIAADGNIYPCCLDGNESVLIKTSRGIESKFIKDIEIGDEIYGSNEKVLKKFEKPNQECLRITLKNNREIIASKDHIFYILDDYEIKSSRKKEIGKYRLSEILAENLTTDLKIPVRYKFTSKSTKLDLNDAYLIGWYIAEGWKSKDGSIGFMFGKKDDTYQFFKILKKRKYSYKRYIRKTGIQVMVRSKELNKILEDCGSRASNKKIPALVLNSDIEAKKQFLKSYIDGDGCILKPSKNYNNYKVVMSTISGKLASDLILLLNTMGIFGTCRKDKRRGLMKIENRVVNVQDRWNVIIAGNYNFEKLDFIPYRVRNKKNHVKRALGFLKDDEYLFIPIKKIEKCYSENGMYDIQIKGDPKFISSFGILTHNCGVQYALKGSKKDFINRMSMGKDLKNIIFSQNCFDGSFCDVCYYSGYNSLLNALLVDVKHKEWI